MITKPFSIPSVEGNDVYTVDMQPHHWYELGTALKRLHTLEVPPDIRSGIRQETYYSDGRESVKQFLERIETETYADPVAIELAVFLRSKRKEVLDLVARSEQLAQVLKNSTSRVGDVSLRFARWQPPHWQRWRTLHRRLGRPNSGTERTRFDVHWRWFTVFWLVSAGRKNSAFTQPTVMWTSTKLHWPTIVMSASSKTLWSIVKSCCSPMKVAKIVLNLSSI